MEKSIIVAVLIVSLEVGLSEQAERLGGYKLHDIIDALLSTLGVSADALLTIDTPTPIEEDVTFWCCNSNTQTVQQTGIDDPEVDSTLDLSLPFIFLIHGYVENVEKKWAQDTLRDLCQYRSTNACGVDWRRLAGFIYALASKHTLKVGKYLATFIEFLLAKGVPMDDITIVGHSLGAHIAGIAGSTLGGRVPMIIGLDPAGPLMTFPILKQLDERLDPTDAQFVQAIYTCILFLGSAHPLATQNFYPAGGIAPQPWCTRTVLRIPTPESVVCSHFVAPELFRRSINQQKVIEGTKCDSHLGFKAKRCARNEKDRLGLDSSQIPGKFYFEFNTPTLSVLDFVFGQ